MAVKSINSAVGPSVDIIKDFKSKGSSNNKSKFALALMKNKKKK